MLKDHKTRAGKSIGRKKRLIRRTTSRHKTSNKPTPHHQRDKQLKKHAEEFMAAGGKRNSTIITNQVAITRGYSKKNDRRNKSQDSGKQTHIVMALTYICSEYRYK